ncbi:MAG: SulP family inorganic anion transporter [Cyclobacteriaceae bacterium]
MKKSIQYYRTLWLHHDLPAGVSVFLIALPLCLGIALASGAPLYAGLLSGMIGGLVVTLISGSPLAVSGPAAGLTTLVSTSILSLGDYRVFLLAVIIAGLLQICLGLLRLGIVVSYFPSAVIKGMLAAIGIILISKQIPVALGYDHPNFWTRDLVGLFSSENPFRILSNVGQHIHAGAIITSIISIAILVVLQLPFARHLKFIPAPLVVVVAGVFIVTIFNAFIPEFSVRPIQSVNLPENVFSSISFPDLSQFFSNTEIWKDGITIGMLATLETLLCIEAIDKLDKSNRITPVNRELFAQGIGNIACGFLGAIPLTAVVVRGAANVDAGARTKLASFTHGLFLLLAVLLVPFLLNKIPYPALAAILIITGYNLTKPKLYRNMLSLGRKQFIPFLATIVAILATDLLIGVGIGVFISTHFIVRNNLKAQYKISKKIINGIETEYIKLNSNVTFLNKVNLQKTLDEVPEYSVLTIDGSECNFIEYDILEIISEYERKAHDRHIELHLIGIERVSVSAIH